MVEEDIEVELINVKVDRLPLKLSILNSDIIDENKIKLLEMLKTVEILHSLGINS